MRMLLVKTSSMGDIIHTLPALTDVMRAMPEIEIDWLVEESFSVIPTWHPAVSKVIPVGWRRWRKEIWSRTTWDGFREWHTSLTKEPYDLILDAQGLLKSAFMARFARGKRVGLDWGSAREPVASLFYQQRCTVNFQQHAVVRMRHLFSQALGYALPNTEPDFYLNQHSFATVSFDQPYILFLFETTWSSKQWPDDYWMQLANHVTAMGYQVKISAFHPDAIAKAEHIANEIQGVSVLSALGIDVMASWLRHASAVVAVDTGFGHLSAALGTKTVSIYGATDAAMTGALGPHVKHLSVQFPCAPCLSRTCQYKGASIQKPACYETVPPEQVKHVLAQWSSGL